MTNLVTEHLYRAMGKPRARLIDHVDLRTSSCHGFSATDGFRRSARFDDADRHSVHAAQQLVRRAFDLPDLEPDDPAHEYFERAQHFEPGEVHARAHIYARPEPEPLLLRLRWILKRSAYSHRRSSRLAEA
ncbi:hypothetical protein ABC974_26610 [Sphingomonas oligophenolica]|uniref:Uncharacterized protein n=1 Tax=Sphingomonas oligophenolica TaxID=301154 RepID=A0ABU9YBN9_9SPHN